MDRFLFFPRIQNRAVGRSAFAKIVRAPRRQRLFPTCRRFSELENGRSKRTKTANLSLNPISRVERSDVRLTFPFSISENFKTSRGSVSIFSKQKIEPW